MTVPRDPLEWLRYREALVNDTYGVILQNGALLWPQRQVGPFDPAFAPKALPLSQHGRTPR